MRALRYLGRDAARKFAAWLGLALDALEASAPDLRGAGLETLQMLQATVPESAPPSGLAHSAEQGSALRIE